MAVSRRVIFLLFAMVLQSSLLQVSAWLSGKVHVDIQNNLEPSKAELQVQCKSKNDDLGNHIVNYQETYEFKFKNNFWDTTHFFCYFQWPKPDGKWVQGGPYDIYVAKRDQERCLHRCNWSIEEEGLYSYSIKTNIWENLYNWPSP